MTISELQAIFACVCKAMAGFAVPCFVMLSGAFNLADERNAKCGPYYRKTFLKIGVHTVVFSILYFLYRSVFCFVGEQNGKAEFMTVLFDLLRGSPMGHMAYLYRMAAIYFLTPFLIRLKNRWSESIFVPAAIVSFILAGRLSACTEEYRILQIWDIGQLVEYLGYFLLGYLIRKYVPRHGVGGILCITLGFLLEIGLGIILYSEIFLDEQIPASGIWGIAASLLIFAGFTMIAVRTRKIIAQLSGLSFIIYLVHQGVTDMLSKILFHVIGPYYYVPMNSLIWIPLMTAVVLLTSTGLTYVYNWAYDRANRLTYTCCKPDRKTK